MLVVVVLLTLLLRVRAAVGKANASILSGSSSSRRTRRRRTASRREEGAARVGVCVGWVYTYTASLPSPLHVPLLFNRLAVAPEPLLEVDMMAPFRSLACVRAGAGPVECGVCVVLLVCRSERCGFLMPHHPQGLAPSAFKHKAIRRSASESKLQTSTANQRINVAAL